jgi:hypothetical protein
MNDELLRARIRELEVEAQQAIDAHKHATARLYL